MSCFRHDLSAATNSRSDGNIRYYEYEGDSLHSLNEYKSSEPRESNPCLWSLDLPFATKADGEHVADRRQNAG